MSIIASLCLRSRRLFFVWCFVFPSAAPLRRCCLFFWPAAASCPTCSALDRAIHRSLLLLLLLLPACFCVVVWDAADGVHACSAA